MEGLSAGEAGSKEDLSALQIRYDLEKIDRLAKLDKSISNTFVLSREEHEKVKKALKALVKNTVSDESIDLYINERLALGKLTPFLLNEELEEIMYIGRGAPIYVFDRKKGMVKTPVVLEEEEAVEIIKRIARYSGRVVNSEYPLLDGRLPDGSRVNATLADVTPRGPTITIRKFQTRSLTIVELIKLGTLTSSLAAFLWLVIEGIGGIKPANTLIIGGTASGKTTTLNALSVFIPRRERIVTIEDTLELRLMHEHWIPMETKLPQHESGSEVTMDELLKNSLRMRPDRIIVGEVRGKEALTLFTAMNTGHEGTLATIHANSGREALSRLQSHPMNVPDIMIPALDLMVAQNRQINEEGKLVRRVTEVMEVSGKEADVFQTNTLFKYDPKTKTIEEKVLNGRIIHELSRLTGRKINEIDEEIERRKTIVEAMVEAELPLGGIYNIVQTYYEDPDKAVDTLHTLATKAKSK
ncbi:MAG: CpaF family protein [Methanobacteriota archaeon]|nr:MAG: CpaF family protein [Euryarchaeota archaeon]